MKRTATVLISLLSMSILAGAQVPELPAKCIAFQPSAVRKEIIKESEVMRLASTNWGQDEAVKGEKKYWIVYSDRAGNVGYTAPGSSTKCADIDFNEKLIIAKIQNNYALVYTDPKSEQYPKISSYAQCKGWVPMSKLLLWGSCLANDRGIYNKALLCINLDNLSRSTESVGQGFLSPENKSHGVPLASDMKFYFIMKREKGLALLATQYKMDGYSDKVLSFWVPEASYVPWNQRSCAEPTWEHEDVEYFSAKKEKIEIYKDIQKNGQPISSIEFSWRNSEKYDKYEYRMSGDELRYPILDDGNKVIYSMSTFSTIGGKTTVGIKEKTENEKIEEQRRKVLEDMKNINLGIVIDGTSSMEEFYPAVKEAIKEGCKFFSGRYKIKVGVAIYRDYEDGEEGLVEVLPMTDPKTGMAKLEAFLNSGGNYGIKSSSKDRTNTEALFCGMNTALSRFTYKKGQSNIMLVVGDCGNAAADDENEKAAKYGKKPVTQDQLIAKLAEKEVHLMGFQVRNKNQADWNAFNNQLQTMMRTTLKKRFDAMEGLKGTKVQGKQYVNNGQLNGYDFMGANVDMDLYIFNHRFTDPNVNGGTMEINTLSTYMENAIGSFAQTVQKTIDVIQQADASKIIEDLKKSNFTNGDVTTSGPNKVSDAFLKDKFKAAGLDLSSVNAVINFRGYTSKISDSQRSFFKPVIFISVEEFQELLKRLQPVYEAAVNKSNDREPYINAMKALVKSLAPGMSDADMAKLGNGEIMSMIAGLNEASAALNEYTLSDLANQTVVPPQKYLKILTDFTRSFKNLSKIKNSTTYKYVKDVNGVKYYWIPIEDLP